MATFHPPCSVFSPSLPARLQTSSVLRAPGAGGAPAEGTGSFRVAGSAPHPWKSIKFQRSGVLSQCPLTLPPSIALIVVDLSHRLHYHASSLLSWGHGCFVLWPSFPQGSRTHVSLFPSWPWIPPGVHFRCVNGLCALRWMHTSSHPPPAPVPIFYTRSLPKPRFQTCAILVLYLNGSNSCHWGILLPL